MHYLIWKLEINTTITTTTPQDRTGASNRKCEMHLLDYFNFHFNLLL